MWIIHHRCNRTMTDPPRAAEMASPVDIVFLLLLPSASSGEHLNVLAAVARKLRNSTELLILRNARDRTALHSAMVSP